MKSPFFLILTVSSLVTLGLGYLFFFGGQRDGREIEWPFLNGGNLGTNRSLNYFIRQEEESEYRLTYGWKDFAGKDYLATFPVTKKNLADSEDEFGYDPEEFQKDLKDYEDRLRRDMIARLTDTAQKLIVKSSYPDYLSVDGSNPLSFNIKISAPPEIYTDVKEEFTRITEAVADEQDRHLKRIDSAQKKFRIDYLHAGGIRVLGDKIGVDYTLAVERNRDRVAQVFQSLKKSAGKMSLHRFLGVLTAFVQEIRYGIPPKEEEGKMILEFWVPPKVLVSNFGDCDSKGVTLASLWMNFKRYPLIFIKIPKHLFLGIAVPARQEEGFVLNGLRYTLIEVTGPDKIPPGMITRYSLMYLEAGKYVYELLR